jgi:hypothetical protein
MTYYLKITVKKYKDIQDDSVWHYDYHLNTDLIFDSRLIEEEEYLICKTMYDIPETDDIKYITEEEYLNLI